MNFIEDFVDFLNESPTSYQVVRNVIHQLKGFVFERLDLEEEWRLDYHSNYYVELNDSAVVAFRTAGSKEGAFRMIASHSDSPLFQIKPKPLASNKAEITFVRTDMYGGAITNTWLDRPLSIAGRVLVKGDHPFEPKTRLVNFKKPIGIMPNAAIHLNREVNTDYQVDLEKDTFPLIGLKKSLEDLDFYEILQKELETEEEILDYDLYFYPTEKAEIIGLKEEFISSGRIDNQAMVHASLKALLTSSPSEDTQLLLILDKEEVGSSSREGAASSFTRDLLTKIYESLNNKELDFVDVFKRSFLLSADMSHALHPHFLPLSDEVNYPILNQGPVIKRNPRLSYTTDGFSSAVIKTIAEEAEVSLQTFTDRSGTRGGSTLGPILVESLGIPGVDLGNPMFSMHSARELAGTKDHEEMIKLMKKFFQIV